MVVATFDQTLVDICLLSSGRWGERKQEQIKEEGGICL